MERVTFLCYCREWQFCQTVLLVAGRCLNHGCTRIIGFHGASHRDSLFHPCHLVIRSIRDSDDVRGSVPEPIFSRCPAVLALKAATSSRPAAVARGCPNHGCTQTIGFHGASHRDCLFHPCHPVIRSIRDSDNERHLLQVRGPPCAQGSYLVSDLRQWLGDV